MSIPMPARPIVGLAFFILSISVLFLMLGATSREEMMPERGAVVLTGAENHQISITEADNLISNYRISSPADAIHGEMFGKETLIRILQQQECVGLRIYYAKREDGTPVLVIMGVDAYGRDLRSGEIAEHGLLCPPICHGANSEVF